MHLLSGRGLTRRPLFADLSIDLGPGEVVVLSGPSASGKTLLLRGLADLDPLDGSTVELAGRPRESFAPSEWRRRVLYVHQSAPRLPGTVGENLARTDALRSQAEPSAPVPAGLPALDPEADAERLSGGEAQILALHRAFRAAPRVLLLDEPTSALDEPRARAVEGAVSTWAEGGRAVLWVSHEKALAPRLGARAVAMPAG